MGLPPPDFESGASASSATPGKPQMDAPNRKKTASAKASVGKVQARRKAVPV